MAETVLDTDILSEIYKRRDLVVLANAKRYLREYSALTYASVSLVEILSGLYAKDARRQLADTLLFLESQTQIIPQPEDYKLAAQIIGLLVRRGRPIGSDDPLIAACAINRGMKVATGNIRHYQFVVDAGFTLELVNWREP